MEADSGRDESVWALNSWWREGVISALLALGRGLAFQRSSVQIVFS